MKKTIGLLLAMLLLASVCGAAFAEGGANEAKSICWADVAKDVAEAEESGEFLPLGNWDLMMWIPSNLDIGEVSDKDGEQGLVASFNADDGSASLNCVWDWTHDKSLAGWLTEVKKLGYADADYVTINGLPCIAWTESGSDCMKVLHIPDDSSVAITLIFSPMSNESFARTSKIMEHSLMPACLFYENGGLLLPVAARYSDLVTVITPQDDEYGELFSVSETASIMAAQATGQDFDGAGWLFSIARVTEDRLHEMLCYYMFGSDVFGKDEQGMYYLFNHPTDVRIVRESYDSMDEDIKIWSELNQWAWQEKSSFLYLNPDIKAETRGNSDPEIFLARVAWMDGETYTISSADGDIRKSGTADPIPYVEKLTTGVFIDELYEGEEPTGEYFRLTMPKEGVSLDFFQAEDSQNIIRIIWNDDGQVSLWKAEYADGMTTAGNVVREWYEAMKS